MGVYKARITSAEIRRAAENGKQLEEKGRVRGGKRFFSNRWVNFNSDEVDMASILESAEQQMVTHGADKGKKEAGELEVHFVSGEKWTPPKPPAPEPVIVPERISDEERLAAREAELKRRREGKPEKPKKRGRPKKEGK
jgi:hypothetical protein